MRLTDIEAQKINGTILDTLKMVVAAFTVMNKTNKVKFFEKTFLIANVSPKVVFGILFLILSDADVNFFGWELR